MKILRTFKMMDRHNKIVTIFTFIISIFLIVNIISTIMHLKDFSKSKNSGNERWNQVEIRIKEYEQKIDSIQNEINNLKQGGK